MTLYAKKKCTSGVLAAKGVCHCSLSGISSEYSSTSDRLEAQQKAVNKTFNVFQDAINKSQFFYLSFHLAYALV